MYFSWVSLYCIFVQCIFQRSDGLVCLLEAVDGSVSVAIDVTLMIETNATRCSGAVQSWRQSVSSPWVPSGISCGFKLLYKDYSVWSTSLWSLFSNLCLKKKNTQRLQNSYLSYDCTVWLFKSFKPQTAYCKPKTTAIKKQKTRKFQGNSENAHSLWGFKTKRLSTTWVKNPCHLHGIID